MWYKEHIEKPIRDAVRLLRNNGFNTSCSCGHEMYIQCQHLTDGEVMRLDHLLFNNGYRNYTINILLERSDGYILSSFIEIKFKDKEIE